MNQIPAIAGGNPVRSDYLVFGSPSIGEEEISEVTESLRSMFDEIVKSGK